MTEKVNSAPPDWLIRMFMPIIQSIQPSVCINLEGDQPYIISPLMTTMQTIGELNALLRLSCILLFAVLCRLYVYLRCCDSIFVMTAPVVV